MEKSAKGATKREETHGKRGAERQEGGGRLPPRDDHRRESSNLEG